jgi:CDP-6-deoxy-D-xylo-4-hexulose-3-dehydrase
LVKPGNTPIRIMHDTLWIGVFPGLTKEMMDFSISKIEEFFGVNF